MVAVCVVANNDTEKEKEGGRVKRIGAGNTVRNNNGLVRRGPRARISQWSTLPRVRQEHDRTGELRAYKRHRSNIRDVYVNNGTVRALWSGLFPNRAVIVRRCREKPKIHRHATKTELRAATLAQWRLLANQNTVSAIDVHRSNNAERAPTHAPALTRGAIAPSIKEPMDREPAFIGRISCCYIIVREGIDTGVISTSLRLPHVKMIYPCQFVIHDEKTTTAP